MIPKVLSIAGSDPSGGAGIQADLKTFSALGCYGMAALTSLTAQNTRGVTAVQALPPQFVRQQVEAIFEDVAVHSIKIGMLSSAEVANTLADMLVELKVKNLVLDPVMVATSGDRLISDAAIDAVRTRLLPLADVITPNIPEAETLLNQNFELDFRGNLEAMAFALKDIGARAVFLKGGHLIKRPVSTDILVTEQGEIHVFETDRILTSSTHGTGCTLSSAIAAYIAKGEVMDQACEKAKFFVTHALLHGHELGVGHGHGPVHHFWDLWK